MGCMFFSSNYELSLWKTQYLVILERDVMVKPEVLQLFVGSYEFIMYIGIIRTWVVYVYPQANARKLCSEFLAIIPNLQTNSHIKA